MLLVAAHPAFSAHDPGPWHPERAQRLAAALDGVRAAGLSDAVVPLEPREATRAELSRVHAPEYFDALERFCATGGGSLDPDTRVGVSSWQAALLAAGTGMAAV